MRDERELMKLEGAEAISQLQELANMIKYQRELPREFSYQRQGTDSVVIL
jgi:hypothetical protein